MELREGAQLLGSADLSPDLAFAGKMKRARTTGSERARGGVSRSIGGVSLSTGGAEAAAAIYPGKHRGFRDGWKGRNAAAHDTFENVTMCVDSAWYADEKERFQTCNRLNSLKFSNTDRAIVTISERGLVAKKQHEKYVFLSLTPLIPSRSRSSSSSLSLPLPACLPASLPILSLSLSLSFSLSLSLSLCISFSPPLPWNLLFLSKQRS